MKKILFALLLISMALGQFDNTVAGWGRDNDFIVPNTSYSGEIVVADESTLAAESLDEVDFATTVEWTEAGDFTEDAGVAFDYAYSGGTGSLTQIQANLVIAGVGDRWYKFEYTISSETNFAGAMTITTGFASSAVSLNVVDGTHTVYFKSKSTPVDFVISVTSTAGSFTIDDVTLKEIQGGDLYVYGNLFVRGTFDVVGTGTEFAEMYLNANGNPTTIETAATPIAVREFTTGSLHGWTYVAGSTGAVTAYYDRGANVGVHDDTHGLSTGDIISIRGTTDYNGIFSVTVVDADSFYIADTWNNDNGASDWDEGDYLLAGAAAAGTYMTDYNISTSEGGGAGSTVNYCLYKNATPQNKTIMQRKFANNDVGAIPGGGEIVIAVADRLFLTQQSTGTNALTNSYGNVRIEKL